MLQIRTIALGVFFAALTACTPMHWEQPNSHTVASAEEINECDRSAYVEARRQAFFYSVFWGRGSYPGWGYPGWRARYYRDPWWGVPYGSQDTFFLERQLADYCMRSKGYRLAPARPADRS